MATFQEQARAYHEQHATRPPATLVLEVNDFSTGWAKRPQDSICCGLRVLSAQDEDTAKVEAHKKAIDSDDYEAELKKRYLIEYCAQVICDPNDIERHCEPFDMASEQLPTALTSQALLKIYDTAERLKIDTSPLFTEATDEDIDELVVQLMGNGLEQLRISNEAKALRVRRYARFMLDDLRDG